MKLNAIIVIYVLVATVQAIDYRKFNNYDDIQKNVNRQRSLLENPTRDSYISAFNQRHQNDHHIIVRRSADPYDLIKFELTDAKTPDEETKKIIATHRAKHLKQLKDDEDKVNATIVIGSRKSAAKKEEGKKITKRSDVGVYQERIDQDSVESRKLKLFHPIKAKKSLGNFPVDVQKAINMVVMYDKFNNIGLRYASTPHKPFFGDKLNHYNQAADNYHKQNNNYETNFKAAAAIPPKPTKQHVYSEPELPVYHHQTSKTESSQNHLSAIDEHSIIQKQKMIEIDPVNYVLHEVPAPSLGGGGGGGHHKKIHQTEQLLPPISYKDYVATSNKLDSTATSHSGYDDNKEFIIHTVEHEKPLKSSNNNQPQLQYEEHVVPYESLSDYEKQLFHEQHKSQDDSYTTYYQHENHGNDDVNKYESTLSSLVGKSTSDQLHGLTYILEKELMNSNKMHQQQQQQQQQKRPQDNRSPILFHPDNMVGAGVVGTGKNIYINKYGFKEVTKPIVEDHHHQTPIVEAVEEVHSHSIVHITPTPPKSTVHHVSDLSPNYKGLPSSHIYPKEYGIKMDDKGYAAKYDFGYRVRDFHTGNDFGHKQNRDLAGVTRGEYHILLPDGRVQNVRYHADDSGFHADVSFETGH